MIRTSPLAWEWRYVPIIVPLARFVVVAAAVLLAAMAGWSAAHAAPPPGANPDSEIARWIQSTRDYHGVGCCSEADCRRTAVHVNAAGEWEAWIDKDAYGAQAPDAWVKVPAFAFEATSDGPPPDGRVWACFYAGKIHCFFSAGGW